LPSDTPLERYFQEAQRAATLDLLSFADQTAAFAGIVLITEDPALIQEAQGLSIPLTLETGGSNFHFGEVFRTVCEKHRLQRVVYAGGAALPLASPDLLKDLALTVSGEGPCVVANSLFSADFVAFYPAGAFSRIPLPATDNNLAWLLHFNAGLPFAATPRTLATQFDIDTPPDLAVLHLACRRGSRTAHTEAVPVVGAHLDRIVERVPEVMPVLAGNLARAYEVMGTRRAQLFVAGRVSSWVWRRLEVNLPCETRVLSEERGMQAGGREAKGEVLSLLGLHMDAVGMDGLVRSLEETCDAAFLDTRVLFAHRHLQVSRSDRFNSDALQPGGITDSWVRALTSALALARIPVVLGGHSLVSGGVWALSERIRASASSG
jgi:hypothetical protein